MSHELRTPHHASRLRELIEMGIGGRSPAAREYLARIRGSQEHLLGIINDLLNSRVEAGQCGYRLTPFPCTGGRRVCCR